MSIPFDYSPRYPKKPAPPSLAEHTQSLPKSYARGEQALWRAVITQVLMDAASQSQKCAALKDKRDALLWLSEMGDDFHFICDLAGLDGAYVFEKATLAIAQNCEWKQRHGTGWRTVKLCRQNNAIDCFKEAL